MRFQELSDGTTNWVSDNKPYGISSNNVFKQITNPQTLKAEGIYPGRGTLKLTVIEDNEEKRSFNPYIQNKQITLNAGDYSYTDFVDRVNELITFIDSNDTLTNLNLSGNNTLLLNTGHLLYDTAGTGLYQQGALWIRSTDGAKGFKLEAKSALAPSAQDQVYFGTNQFVLAFDEITNRVYFKYLNMPIYEGGSGDEAIKFENIGGGNIKLTNKSSGILIDSIITTDVVTGELINLFNGILGFNMGNLHPNFETVKNNTLTGLDDRSFKTGVLQDGLNTTGGLSSLDTIVQKKAPTPASGDPPEQNLYKFAPQD